MPAPMKAMTAYYAFTWYISLVCTLLWFLPILVRVHRDKIKVCQSMDFVAAKLTAEHICVKEVVLTVRIASAK